jgi:hypothetical protein
VTARLGRSLQPEDFRKNDQTIKYRDPAEKPMGLEDYGIIDALTLAMLAAIDQGLIDGLTS